MSIDKTVKLIILGDSCVGKSTFFFKLQNKVAESCATIGVDFFSSIIDLNTEIIKYTLWDTSGHERYTSITNNYLQNVAGIILVFDVTNPTSLDNLTNWMNKLYEINKCNHSHPILLLGNKCDIPHFINKDSLEQWISKPNVIYKAISSIDIDQQTLEEYIKILLHKIIENFNQLLNNPLSNNPLLNNPLLNNQLPNNQLPNNQLPNNQLSNNQSQLNHLLINKLPKNQICYGIISNNDIDYTQKKIDKRIKGKKGKKKCCLIQLIEFLYKKN